MSTHHLGPANSSTSTNVVKHLLARKSRGPVCVQRSWPTEIYQSTHLYRKLMGHLSSVYCVCFDQTGQYIFTGADDHLIKIWSARDGRLLKTLRGHDGEITDMSVNFENRLLASGGMDRIIRIWDLKTSKLLECLNAHSAMVTSVKFSPYNRHGKDRYLLSTSNDGYVIIWSYHVDKCGPFKKVLRYKERNNPKGRIICSSFSAGGSFVACGSSDNYIHLYGFHPVDGPYWMKEICEHTDQVDSIQFSHHGHRFVTGSQDGTARIYSFKKGIGLDSIKLDMNTQLDQSIEEHVELRPRPRVLIVQWSRDDRYVMTSIVDHSIKVWDSYTGRLLHILKEHKHDVYLIESHPIDPRIFLSASHDGTMILWDIEKATVIKKYLNLVDLPENYESTGVASIYDVKFSPDGNMIAATDSYGYLSLFGNGNKAPYQHLPDQMFFHTDYRSLIRDMRHFVMDEQTHVAPHLMPKPTLVDMNGNPHPFYYQRYVSDFRSSYVIPPLSETQLSSIAESIEWHSILEDDEYLTACPQIDSGCRSGSSSMNSFDDLSNSRTSDSRYNTRYSTRCSFRNAQGTFMLRSRRPRPTVHYNDFDDEEEINNSRRLVLPHRLRQRPRQQQQQLQLDLQSDSTTSDEDYHDESTEIDSETEEESERVNDSETDIDNSETEIEDDDATEIDSDATEIDDTILIQLERQNQHTNRVNRISHTNHTNHTNHPEEDEEEEEEEEEEETNGQDRYSFRRRTNRRGHEQNDYYYGSESDHDHDRETRHSARLQARRRKRLRRS